MILKYNVGDLSVQVQENSFITKISVRVIGSYAHVISPIHPEVSFVINLTTVCLTKLTLSSTTWMSKSKNFQKLLEDNFRSSNNVFALFQTEKFISFNYNFRNDSGRFLNSFQYLQIVKYFKSSYEHFDYLQISHGMAGERRVAKSCRSRCAVNS